MLQADQIDPRVLGERLAEARKERGVTQEEAAEYLGCSRPTLIGIEKGTRLPSEEEIYRLASFYGRKVHELLRRGEPVFDLQPHLRTVAKEIKGTEPEVVQAIADLQRFAEDYVRLEKLLQVGLRMNYPREVRLGGRVKVADLAEDVAVEERQRLGLGDQPVIFLRSFLEAEIGLRIVYEDLPSRVAGLFAYSDELGGVIAVNRRHPAERRRATMVHEYGHLITDRYKPGIDYLSWKGRKPANERFAEQFSMAFLMPSTSVRRRFHQVVEERDDFQIADLCRLSHYYFVSVEAMALRLEGLGLIPKGIRDYLKGSGFRVRQAAEVLDLQEQPVNDNKFPDRYIFLAVQAFDRGDLSEGELASLLRCDRVTAREIVEKYLTSTDVSDEGEVSGMQFDLGNSLLSKPK